MSAVELRTRILISSGLAVIFIGYFIYSYFADAASGSWIALGVDGLILAIGTFCAFAVIRSVWQLFSGKSANEPRTAAKTRESADFRG